MKSLSIVLLVAIGCVSGDDTEANERLQPSVMLAMLIRNKEPFLAHTLSQLSALKYPKKRISLWIRSDHNEDRSLEILNRWLDTNSDLFHSTDIVLNASTPQRWPDEHGAVHLSDMRYRHVISLKEEAIEKARRMWADFIWFLDADVVLLRPDILTYLISIDKPIVAPLLTSVTVYSNFWGAMNEDFYYKRSETYLSIYNREELGCFTVPLVHSCVLVNLRLEASSFLTFDRSHMQIPIGPVDDLISFSLSAIQTGLSSYVCNEHYDGSIPIPLEHDEDISQDWSNMKDIQLNAVNMNVSLELHPALKHFADNGRPANRLGFDKIYVINLARRPDRKARMTRSLQILGIEAELVEAVDGKNIDQRYLVDNGIEILPEYEDPYWHRPIKMGEVACFLSHYRIWKDILEHGYQRVMILEDDVRFGPRFVERIDYLMHEVQHLQLDWDLIYLGRKIMEHDEDLVAGSSVLAHPKYSYWTLGYLLSASGARTLIESDPLTRLIPVDEYIPLMFDQHANVSWKAHFSNRNLRAFSATPLLLEPLHYSSEKEYVSDTEDSALVCDGVDSCQKEQ